MKISLFNISVKQSNIIKGIAIISIVLHNLIHWTNQVGENEMDYDPSRLQRLIEEIIKDPLFTINGIFSYLGYITITLFLFVSAYGLTKQRMKNPNIGYFSYFINRFIKLYALIIFGLIIYFPFAFNLLNLELSDIPKISLGVLSMTDNFSMDTLSSRPGLGPWWFFALIFQVYLLFPLLYKIIDEYGKRGAAFLFASSFVIMIIFGNSLTNSGFPFYANITGHMPEILLGICAARYKNFKLDWSYIVAAIALFILANLSEWLFPFQFLAACILLLSVCYWFMKRENNIVSKCLMFVGEISMFMFISNGFIRFYTVNLMKYFAPLPVLFYAIVHLLAVILISYLMHLVYNRTFVPIINNLIKRI